MRRIIALIALASLLALLIWLVPSVAGLVSAIDQPLVVAIRPTASATDTAASATPSIGATGTRPAATAPLAPSPTIEPTPEPTVAPSATTIVAPTTLPTAAPTIMPAPPPAPTPIVVKGLPYDAYIPTATKPRQFYQYSCEFDAAWVILQTYGIEASGDEIIGSIEHDRSIEPYYLETSQGFVIYGGNIADAYSGDYTHNFLARSTSTAMQKVFARYDLGTTLVHDRAGIEAALRAGQLVWIKTTVDFKAWRPATWIMPDGTTHRTVLGNDHAVVVMGFSDRGVVIRDVLGPTSSNRNRPYEYEIDWQTFMAAWGAQSFDGLAVAPPR